MNANRMDAAGPEFGDLVESGCYVDKSLLVKDTVTRNPRGRFLFLRPPGFGRSTALSMLESFFGSEHREEPWFDGLQVACCPECMARRGAHPVIRLELGDVCAGDFQGYISGVRAAMARTFEKFRHILDSDMLMEDERRRFLDTLGMGIADFLLDSDLRFLCELVRRHQGARPVLLVDGYDAVFYGRLGEDATRGISGFLGDMMSSALDGNDDLQMAFVTGTMRVSNLTDRLTVNDILSPGYGERFGFTDEEVTQVLERNGCRLGLEDVRRRCGGYRFGDAEVFSPSRVMDLVRRGDAVGRDLRIAGPSDDDFPFRGISGRTMGEGELRRACVDRLGRAGTGATVPYMVMAGLLSAEPVGVEDGFRRYRLSVPNGMAADALGGRAGDVQDVIGPVRRRGG